MKKRNIVMIIVSVAIFIVLVVSATYAYFASNTNTGNGLDFSTTLDENNIAFTATSGTLSLHVAAENMLESQTGSGDVLAAESVGEENITITLSSNTETPIVCNYNVYFQWNTNAAYTTPTATDKNEFTLELDLQDSDGIGSEGTNKFASETQLTRVITSTNKTLIVEGASIIGSSVDSGSQTWVPTAKFYNLTDDQSDLAGSTFSGKFTIEDVECNAMKNLSETVIGLVSDDDYTSSQDSTAYRVKQEYSRGATADATYTKITDYGTSTPKMYSTTDSDTATSGTNISGVFTKTSNGTWSNVPSTMTKGTYYHLVLPIKEDGYYQICYSGSDHHDLQLSAMVIDSTNSVIIKNSTINFVYTSGCYYIGELTTNNAVRIVNYKNEYYNGNIPTMSFYLQKSNKDITLDAGVRFEGKDPNNYVTFNGGEEWRIIGTFEGSTIGLEPGKQYTKLIRSDYIDYMYGDTESWENSSINQYLNSDYLNSMSDKDKIAKYNNNYGTFYLKSKLRYDVYSDSASDWFLIERELGDYPTGSIKSAIGLMYISDYFYAEYGEGSFPSWLENDYSVEEGEGEYYGEYQYVINTGGNDGYLMYINGGGVNWTETPDSYTVRPVLYLEADTNILKGTGTKADPYVLN